MLTGIDKDSKSNLILQALRDDGRLSLHDIRSAGGQHVAYIIDDSAVDGGSRDMCLLNLVTSLSFRPRLSSDIAIELSRITENSTSVVPQPELLCMEDENKWLLQALEETPRELASVLLSAIAPHENLLAHLSGFISQFGAGTVITALATAKTLLSSASFPAIWYASLLLSRRELRFGRAAMDRLSVDQTPHAFAAAPLASRTRSGNDTERNVDPDEVGDARSVLAPFFPRNNAQAPETLEIVTSIVFGAIRDTSVRYDMLSLRRVADSCLADPVLRSSVRIVQSRRGKAEP